MKIVFTFILLIIFSQFAAAQTLIDEYGNLSPDDESGHLDAASNILKQNPNSKLYILMSKEKSMLDGKFLRHFYGVKNFLVMMEVPENSITMIAGKEREQFSVDIWLIKKNEKTPGYDSVSPAELLNRRITKRILFDTACIDCDNSPFVSQFIFREGIDYLAEVLKANPHSTAMLKIARVESLSKTFKEKRELTNQILTRLKQNGVEKNRISIQFTAGFIANFYIVPKSGK